MYVDVGLRWTHFYNILVSLVLLLAIGSVNAEARGADSELRPRFLPRGHLLSLPIVARDVAPGHPSTSGNGTVNGTDSNVGNSSAGWGAVTQVQDRQCVLFSVSF